MAWSQVKSFSLSKMGARQGWCLMNCRLGFGISTGHFASAKADMESQKKNGTLHDISTLPTNVAVPIYVDTTSKYEHVIVSDRGTYYSDGKRLASLTGLKCFGWGELCDGVRVVKWTADPTPAPSTEFLPAKGYWTIGDNDARIGRLATFMRNNFPFYTPASALGNYYGKYIAGAIKEFQRRTGLQADGNVGKLTYAKLQQYGFKG